MARYQIWNGTDSIITPSGAQFTAAEWADRYPWVKLPGVKMIITAGPINGGCALEFSSTVERYQKAGAVLTEVMNDAEVLAAIEAFEDSPPAAQEAGAEERIAAALEAQVLLAEPEAVSALSARSGQAAGSASPGFARVKRNYDRGLWPAALLWVAVEKGHLTRAEAEEILGEADRV